MNNFYERLMAETESERTQLLSIPFIQHGGKGELSLESYLAFLGQAFHHVKHTTPLLMACGSRVPHDKDWLRDAMAEWIFWCLYIGLLKLNLHFQNTRFIIEIITTKNSIVMILPARRKSGTR